MKPVISTGIKGGVGEPGEPFYGTVRVKKKPNPAASAEVNPDAGTTTA